MGLERLVQEDRLPLYSPISGIGNVGTTFPISWLNKQEFCEYQIFLEDVKGIRVKPTEAMVQGKEEHEQLYSQFKEEAVPATFEEMLSQSKTAQVFSREFRVADTKHGIYGLIDEVLLTPDEFIVIDDKPGTRAYLSSIRQVHGYCLAFKEATMSVDNRPIVAALRERGTDNIYWQAPFGKSDEVAIVDVISHIHELLMGNGEFSSSDNPNKCKKCRLAIACDRALS